MITKVIESQSVAQMTNDAFVKNWTELSKSGIKADVILKNPAPANVPVPQVINQISGFTKSCLNLFPMPSNPTEGGFKLRAIGQAIFKPSTQVNFPTGPADIQPAVKLPMMIEASFYESDTTEFRLSVRVAPDNRDQVYA
jgi:hypothetical protein